MNATDAAEEARRLERQAREHKRKEKEHRNASREARAALNDLITRSRRAGILINAAELKEQSQHDSRER